MASLGFDDALIDWRNTKPIRRYVRDIQCVEPEEFRKAGVDKFKIQPYYTKDTLSFSCGNLLMQFKPFCQKTYEIWDAMTIIESNGKPARSKKGIASTYAMASHMFNIMNGQERVKEKVIYKMTDEQKSCMDEMASKLALLKGKPFVDEIAEQYEVDINYTSEDFLEMGNDETLKAKEKLKKLESENLRLKHEIEEVMLNAKIDHERLKLLLHQCEEVKSELKSDNATLLEENAEHRNKLEELDAYLEKMKLESDNKTNTIKMLLSDGQILNTEIACASRGDTTELLKRLKLLGDKIAGSGLDSEEILAHIGHINRLESEYLKTLSKLKEEVPQDDSRNKDNFKSAIRRFRHMCIAKEKTIHLHELLVECYPQQFWPDSSTIEGITMCSEVFECLKNKVQSESREPDWLMRKAIMYKDIWLFHTALKMGRYLIHRRSVLDAVEKTGYQPRKSKKVPKQMCKLINMTLKSIDVRPDVEELGYDIDEGEE